MDLGINDHVAVVTGGGQGLGAAMCTALAAEGCRVAVWDIDQTAAEAVSKSIIASGGQARAIAGDVTNPDQVTEAAGNILGDLGAVQILVNCAGFSRDAPLTEMTDQQWHAVIDVCLTGPFYVTRALVPSMIDRQYGRIINISSRARLGDHNKCNYSAAKAGLVGFTAALSMELGPHHITVNAIAPGFVETERVRGLRYFEDLKTRALQRTNTPRLGTTDDIADAVCYLAAAQSGFITGEVLTVAGGRLR
jgi:3-oxoacyl-[acyl-carrier protein] reductase